MHLKFPARSSPRWRHKYHEDPATVCSTVNYKLQNLSPRLASSLAVNAIINAIRKRPVVHRLYLGDSSLGDAGCIRLFEFLSSPAGLHCKESLTELFLTKNAIGARGLSTVATFLKDNKVLRELCLSGNPLTTDPDVIAQFTAALNSSRLCTLQILHSGSLGDPFVQAFLPQLNAPYLRELDMSAINMTQAIIPTLTNYVRSSRCRLERFQCNANSLTLGGAHKIVSAIKQNHSLQNVRLDDLHIDDHAVAAATALADRTIGWQACNQALLSVLHRNSVHIARVKNESLALLRYSRALFLRSGSGEAGNGVQTPAPPRPSRNSRSFDAPSSFFGLPTELQQEVISYLAPSLSHQQRMGIVKFAADTSTLFHPDCASSTIRPATTIVKAVSRQSHSQRERPSEPTWRPPMWWKCHCPTELRPSCRCLRRWKREMRDIWLTRVACNVYEPIF